MKSSDGGPRKLQWGEIISELEFLFSHKLFWQVIIEIMDCFVTSYQITQIIWHFFQIRTKWYEFQGWRKWGTGELPLPPDFSRSEDITRHPRFSDIPPSLTVQFVYLFSFVCTQTIHPGLRLVPSGNFFLALNRSHHFLLKKVRI